MCSLLDLVSAFLGVEHSSHLSLYPHAPGGIFCFCGPVQCDVLMLTGTHKDRVPQSLGVRRVGFGTNLDEFWSQLHHL